MCRLKWCHDIAFTFNVYAFQYNVEFDFELMKELVRFTRTVKEREREREKRANEFKYRNEWDQQQGERWSKVGKKWEKIISDDFYGLYLQSLMVCYCLSSGVNEVSSISCIAG